jgi:hypothetical protein
MTEPIPKLDSQNLKEPKPQSARMPAVHWLILGFASVVIFAGTVLAMLSALPQPRSRGDYLIAGGVATMLTMLAIFGALLATTLRISDPFYKRRRK